MGGLFSDAHVENQDMFHGACPNLRLIFRTRRCRLVSRAASSPVGPPAMAVLRSGGRTSHLEGNFLRVGRFTSDDGIV